MKNLEKELKDSLKNRVALITYNYIINHIKIVSYENNELNISVDTEDEFTLRIIKNGYNDLINEVLDNITNKKNKIKYSLE